MVKDYKHKIYGEKASNMINAQSILSNKNGVLQIMAPLDILDEIEREESRLEFMKNYKGSEFSNKIAKTR